MNPSHSHPTSSAGYQPLPSEDPPAYAPGPASAMPPGYSAGYNMPTSSYAAYKDMPQPVSSYPGSYQGGAPVGAYPGGAAGYQQQSVIHVVSQTPTPSVIVIGGCPACQVGVLEDDYSCLALCCAIVFFPIGILCCLALKEKRCTNCGAIFG